MIKGFIIGKDFQVNFVIEEDEFIYFRGVLNPDMTQIYGTWGNEPNERKSTFLCTHESHADQELENNVEEREAFHVEPFQSQLAINQEIEANGEPWTDPDFPPDDDSICHTESKGNVKKRGQYEWKRLSEIYPDGCLFQDNCGEGVEISPNDIKQGSLGDCYFLAVLSAMAEFPESIRSLFLNDVNPAGIYSLRFFVNGAPTIVTVDDWVPTQYGEPAFAKAKGG